MDKADPEIGSRFLPETSIRSLKVRRAREKDPAERDRLLALIMRKKGRHIREIDSKIGRGRQTILG